LAAEVTALGFTEPAQGDGPDGIGGFAPFAGKDSGGEPDAVFFDPHAQKTHGHEMAPFVDGDHKTKSQYNFNDSQYVHYFIR
jgi:hypothetical protein